MDRLPFFIDPDIRMAETIPGWFYGDMDLFHKTIESCFLPAWHYVGHRFHEEKDRLLPTRIRAGHLDEPLILSRGFEEPLLFSNVCTHRGNILLDEPSPGPMIRCGYHGRCFDPDGQFKRMPEFRDVANFPSEKDHLRRFDLERLGPLCFGRLSDSGPAWEKTIPFITDRLSWFDFDALRPVSQLSRSYHLEAHWALYVENYLEGFHIPFVHQALNEAIGYEDYETHLFDHGSLQIGIAREGEACFSIPEGAPDHGKRIYAYYFWLFPHLMINVYPWGISFNQVIPVGLKETEIRFETFLLPGMDDSAYEKTALHLTELEDEAVVRQVQRGVTSLAYGRGRFSPTREQGVHHFQRLLTERL